MFSYGTTANKRTFSYDQAYQTKLYSTSRQGEEIIRQFIEQGIVDNRCQLVAIIVPQYIDNGFKGTLRHLAKLGNNKILFIELDQVCELIRMQRIAQNQKQ